MQKGAIRSSKFRKPRTSDLELSPVSLVQLVTQGYSAACYELVFRAVASDSNTPSHEFWSFSTSRLAACSKDTTRRVFGAPSYVGGQIRRSS